MEEMKRILFSVKHLFVVFVLVVSAVVFSMGNVDPFERIGQEEVYQRDYNTFYSELETSAEQILKISIYGKEDSFSYRNINKTLHDYKEIENWKIGEADTTLEEEFFDFGIFSYLIIGYVFFLIFSFEETKRYNLNQLIQISKGGNLLLGVKRTGILAFATSVVTILLYGVRLFVLEVQYGRGMDFSMPVQSLQRFFYIPHCYTIGELLIRLMIIKCLTAIILGCLIWMLYLLLKHPIVTAVGMTLLYFLEYSLQNHLSDSSHLVIFKYVNLQCLVEPTILYETYLNLNLFGYPVGILKINQFFWPFLFGLFMAGIFYRMKTEYPVTEAGIVERYLEKGKAPFLRVLHRMRYLGLESYKILFAQKGIWAILLLFLCLYRYEIPATPFLGMEDFYAETYYEEMGGKLEEDTLLKLEKELEEQRMLASEEDYNIHHLKGLQKVYNQAQQLQERAMESGVAAELISPVAYQSILGKENMLYHLRQTMKLLAMILLISATLIPYEREKQMQYLIQTTPCGTSRFYRKKIWTGLLWTIVIATVFYGREILEASKLYSGFTGITSSVQNLLFLPEWAEGSILFFMILVYLSKLLLCVCVFFLVILVSSGIKRSGNSFMILFLGMEGPLLVFYYLLASTGF